MKGPTLATALDSRLKAAAFRDAGDMPKAEAELRQAVSAFPADANAHAELGITLSMAGRPVEAADSYRAALKLDPSDVGTLCNLAATLKQLNPPQEAEGLLRHVLTIDPDHSAALRNLAIMLRESARWVEAKAVQRRVAQLLPRLEIVLQAGLALTPMARSNAETEAQRADFQHSLEAFASEPETYEYQGQRMPLPWYYLPYHGASDRKLLERTAEVLAAKLPGLAHRAARLAGWRDPRLDGRRIRVAFCSEFLRAHTIGRLYRGLIRDLDRTRFEVVILHGAYSVRDPFRDELDGLADRAVVLPAPPDQQR